MTCSVHFEMLTYILPRNQVLLIPVEISVKFPEISGKVAIAANTDLSGLWSLNIFTGYFIINSLRATVCTNV